MLHTIRDYAFAVLLALLGYMIAGFVSANVRAWAQARGYDTWLLRLLSKLSPSFITRWPTLRQRWWLWLGMGLSGGLAAALWLITTYPGATVAHPQTPQQDTATIESLETKLASTIKTLEETRAERDQLASTQAASQQQLADAKNRIGPEAAISMAN